MIQKRVPAATHSNVDGWDWEAGTFEQLQANIQSSDAERAAFVEEHGDLIRDEPDDVLQDISQCRVANLLVEKLSISTIG